ncbi:MAG: ABC transporter permease [Caldilineaceae bacterium]|nr:ABC transporter permease [Caldilineaceae bacterium]
MKRWVMQNWPAFALFVAVLVLWEGAVWVLSIQQFLLPAPSVIGDAFFGSLSRLTQIGWFTTKEALGGFLIGCTAGILVALATARWTLANETLMPFAIAANSVPIIAFAPILNNWFGVDNPFSKMMIVAVIVFFPMMINTVRGLTAVDPAMLELMRSYAATDFDILRKVRLPNALPYMFNAFKVAATLSMIGAVVSEYFGGNRSALGVFITQEAAQFRFHNAWAGIIVACVVGIAFYGIVLFAERLSMPWHSSLRNSGR